MDQHRSSSSAVAAKAGTGGNTLEPEYLTPETLEKLSQDPTNVVYKYVYDDEGDAEGRRQRLVFSATEVRARMALVREAAAAARTLLSAAADAAAREKEETAAAAPPPLPPFCDNYIRKFILLAEGEGGEVLLPPERSRAIAQEVRRKLGLLDEDGRRQREVREFARAYPRMFEEATEREEGGAAESRARRAVADKMLWLRERVEAGEMTPEAASAQLNLFALQQFNTGMTPAQYEASRKKARKEEK